MRRVLTVLPALLALASCFASEPLLLDPRQAAAPLASGPQMTSGMDPEAVTVVRQADGWYLLRGEDEDYRVLFTALQGTTPRFAFAVSQGGGFVYGVAERRDRRVQLQLPTCSYEARTVALAQGATVDDRSPEVTAPLCLFKDRGSLLAALDRIADRGAGRDWMTSLPAAD